LFFGGFVLSPYQCQPKTLNPFDLKLSDQTPLFLDTIEKAYFERRCFCCCLQIEKWIFKLILVKLIHILFVLANCCWHNKHGFVQWNRWENFFVKIGIVFLL
jgi:hypothetical protein